MNKLLSDIECKGKTIAIEGQAGQGKSLLAIQYLHCYEKPFAWFQLGKDEHDPVLLIEELLELFRISFPEFTSADLENWLIQGDPFPQDCTALAEMLVQDIEKYLQQDFYLVFDDIHFLNGHEYSLLLLSELFKASRHRLHFILISRQPICAVLNIESERSALQLIQNHELALNRQEIAELFNVYFKIPITAATVSQIFEINEGWIMGLILAAHGKPEKTFDPSLLKSIENQSQREFLAYFSHEVLRIIPKDFHDDLLSLSLLDEIPVELGAQISNRPDIATHLIDLEQRNFFVRALNKEKTVFSLHHLFQTCLKYIAEERKSIEWIKKVQNRAGLWYSDSVPEKALSYYLRAGNFHESQNILRQLGMQLLASNRLVTFQQYLSLIPHDVFKNYPWISFFHGAICLSVVPPEALLYLENARSGFIQQRDEIGELAALIQLIFFHAAIDCQFRQGQPLLLRAIHLYEKYKETMDKGQRAHAANIIVIGLTFIEANIERTKNYADFGLEVARQNGYKNLEAEARLARCYRDLFAGRLLDCRQEIEQSLDLLIDPQVSLISKSTLQLAQLNQLANEGDSDSYEYHRRLYLSKYGEEIVEKSSFGPIVRLWEIDLALAQGDITEAETILKDALELYASNILEHIKSLYLQYHAYLSARKGRSEEALEALHESLELRQRIGGNEFIIYNCMLLGATYGRLDRIDEAMGLLSSGLEISEQAGELLIRPAVYAHRAWINLKQGEVESASNDILNMLECFQKTGLRSFYGWDPEVMKDLLSEAVQRKIKPEFSKELALNRLELVIGDDGVTYPLVRFSLLGGITVFCENSSLGSTDLTRSMRDLLVMLITTPKHQLDQEYIQNELWPEEPPNRGRSRFDMLILRIRKLINQNFPKVDAKLILTLQKGILSLENCSIDLDDFRQKIRMGLNHARRKESWQAMELLRQGLHSCHEKMGERVFGDVDLRGATQELMILYLDGCSEYSRLLSKIGMLEEAAKVLKQALRHEPTNEPLVRLLYDLVVQQDHPHKAHQIFQNYKTALEKEEFSEEDIGQILEGFWR